MRYALWLAFFSTLLIGCGVPPGTNSPGSPTPPGTPQYALQSGQWEFSFPSTNSYMEADLQVTAPDFSASANAVTGYAPYFNPNAPSTWGGIGHPFPSGYVLCPNNGQTFTGSTPSSGFLATDSSSGTVYANLTASLSGSNSTVTSLSGQWSSGGSSDPNNYTLWDCENATYTSGNFTATAIAPISRTYSGTLQISGNVTGTTIVTLNISQNGYIISASGTASYGGTLSIGQAEVIGALVYGTGTVSSANGTNQFQFGGRISSSSNSGNAQSITVVFTNVVNGLVFYGTLQ